MKEYVLRKEFDVSDTHEISIDYDGYNFLVIFGHHINGWFIAVPNWGVCVEASDPRSNYYNFTKLTGKFPTDGMAEAIVEGMKEFWEGQYGN